MKKPIVISRNPPAPLSRDLLVRLAFLMILAIHGPAAYASEDRSLPQPSAALHPGEVVGIVIDALARNDFPFPDAGITIAFNFASPSNKLSTGPLERFSTLVKGPVYRDMVNHRNSTISEVRRKGDQAFLFVQIISAEIEPVYFGFRLGLQKEGDYSGMWLTEAVWPVETSGQEVLAL